MLRFGTKTAIAALAFLTLAACGETRTDRGLSGAGIGAAGGALAGAATGGNPVSGALLGGAAGGAVGVFTDKDDLNLGKPVWKR